MNTTGMLRDRRLSDPDLTLTTKGMSETFNTLDGSEGFLGAINKGIESVIQWIKDKLSALWNWLFSKGRNNESLVNRLNKDLGKIKVEGYGDGLSLSPSRVMSIFLTNNNLNKLDTEKFNWSESSNKPTHQVNLNKLNRYLNDYVKLIYSHKKIDDDSVMRGKKDFSAKIGGCKLGIEAGENNNARFYLRDYSVSENVAIVGNKEDFNQLIKIQENLCVHLMEIENEIKTGKSVIENLSNPDDINLFKFKVKINEQIIKHTVKLVKEINGVLESMTKTH